MAHSQNLLTNIVINAKTGSGFSQVGSVLAEMGSIVNGISQELIEFGKDSVEVYKDYEKSMSEAEVALSTTYGRGTRQLSTVMENLDKSASQWAASTIFHTDDVAAAISNAAHAGWDYDQIITGIPAAMQLAQAGSLDLSDAVDYITKATHAAGVEFDDLGDFVDHWTYAANRSATDIEGMGDAMLRMGNTMEYAGGTDELLVMLAELANAGTTGSDAGTLLRNSMLRLVSPTKKARDVMESLGAEGEEIEEILNDEALAAANAELATRGFSAYDDQGNLKSMLEIFTGLNDALDGMTEEEKNNILSSIFPTRSITGAKALLKAASEEWHGLYDELTGGNAEGYGQYAMERMGETLYGQIELFDSKVEALKQKTGEALSEDVGSALSGLGGFVDSLTDMDTGTFNALVSGLEIIAVAGPGIIAASTALRFIGTVLSPGGAIALGVTGLAALTRFFHELSNLDLKSAFGEGEIDHAQLTSFLQGINEDFDASYATVRKFNDEVNRAVKQYQESSTELTSGLLTDLITNKELTPQDIENYFQLGDTMREAVLLGLQGDADAQAEFWTQLFGDGDYVSANQSSSYQTIIDTINEDLQRTKADAEQSSWELREAMTAAFADGKVSEEEYQNILSYVRDLNEKIAQAQQEAQDRESEIAMRVAIDKAQTQSYDDMVESTNQIATERDTKLGELEDNYLHDFYELEIAHENNMAALQEAYENSDNLSERANLRAEMWKEESAYQAAVEDARSEHDSELAYWSDFYNTGIGTMWDTNMKVSDHGEAFGFLEDLAESVANRNKDIFTAAQDFLQSEYYDESGQALINGLTREIEGMGGASEMIAIARSFMESGNMEKAGQYMLPVIEQMIAGGIQDWSIFDGEESLLGAIFGDNWLYSTGRTTEASENVGSVNEYADYVNAGESAATNSRTMVEASDAMTNFFGNLGASMNAIDMTDLEAVNLQWSDMSANIDGFNSQLSYIVDSLGGTYDLGEVFGTLPQIIQDKFSGTQFADMFSAYQLMFGDINPEDFRIQATVEPVIDQNAVLDLEPLIVDVQPNISEEQAMEGLSDEAVVVDVTGETGQLSESISAEDGQTLTELVDGDAGDLHVKIWDEDSQTLTEYAIGDVSQLAAAIDRQNGRHIQIIVDQVQGTTGDTTYATGGRATVASIFGEAGPEWAIPEEHTQRTAELLNAAREASGFTWPELLGQFGGLNADSSHSPSTIVYSPVINSSNSGEIEQILRDDKERLRQMLREERLLQSMEVYA